MQATIGVFLGASIGRSDSLIKAVQQLGAEIANRQLTLVYGGAQVGLMGVLADAVLANQGEVIGVISNDLPNEQAHPGLHYLHRVDTINERKKLLIDLSDGLLAIPGGLGTLEEFTQAWNAVKIGSQKKFLGLLNINGFYDDFLAFIDHAIEHQFMQARHRDLIVVNDEINMLLNAFQQHCTPSIA